MYINNSHGVLDNRNYNFLRRGGITVKRVLLCFLTNDKDSVFIITSVIQCTIVVCRKIIMEYHRHNFC